MKDGYSSISKNDSHQIFKNIYGQESAILQRKSLLTSSKSQKRMKQPTVAKSLNIYKNKLKIEDLKPALKQDHKSPLPNTSLTTL